MLTHAMDLAKGQGGTRCRRYWGCVFGLPDALAQWQEWLASAEPYVNNGWVRIALVLAGIALILWALDGHIGRGRFVPLPTVASWINRLTFGRERYSYPLAQAAEQLTGIPRTDFYKRFLVSEAVNGRFTLYQTDDGGHSFSPVAADLLRRGQIGYSRLAMHKADFWKYLVSIILRMARGRFRARKIR